MSDITPDPIPVSPGEILDRILDPNEEKTPEEWVCADEITRLLALNAELVQALKGVVRVAERATVEFDAARAAIAKAEREGA